jgi:hypothetical protein
MGTARGQQTDNLKLKSYRMGFVFEGEIKNQADSTFSLQYTFSREDVKNYRALVLENSTGRQRVELLSKNRPDGMEIKTGKDQLRVVIRNYDKYDIPVIIEAEDAEGTAYPLYLHGRQENYLGPDELKAQVRALREAMENRNTRDTQDGGKTGKN